MKFSKKIIGLTAILTLCGSVTAHAAEPVGYPRSELQRDVDALRQRGVLGVQARVVTESGVGWAVTSGVADVRTGRPVPPTGHYRIASNTKTFVATVVLQLAGEGRLTLDDPVERHLPGLIRGNGNDGTKITVRHLLQHTSGLHEYRAELPGVGREGFEQHRFDHYEDHQLVALALSRPPDFTPGTGWSYSNTGYVVAGMVVRAVTGNDWRHEVERRIVAPLGLHDTRVPADDHRLPHPHARAYQQWQLGGELSDTTEFNPTVSDAAGAITSTTRDVNRFFRALLSGRLLQPAQQAELTRTVPADPGTSLAYGLGLYRKPLSCGGHYWDHGGNTAGVISRGGVSPDGRRSIAMAFTGAHGDTPQDIAALAASSDRIVDRLFCDR
ncbi:MULTISPECIES: serine hydrolase domain-containing protein [unclassified Saccharothrix]|uniref:serine hydrolase domain-containing protein n=1 Tax=unclassified Saccharothrix TaxID=2593673 RepID=UPI00307D656D